MQKDAEYAEVGDGVKKEVRVNNLWWWPEYHGILVGSDLIPGYKIFCDW